jgi:hypothetical protein
MHAVALQLLMLAAPQFLPNSIIFGAMPGGLGWLAAVPLALVLNCFATVVSLALDVQARRHFIRAHQ